MSSTYIKDSKYQLNLLKIVQDSSKIIEKIGLSIYKPTLELNTIKGEIIDLLLDSNLELIESKINIGFISICGISCFLFASNGDIKEKGKIDLSKKPKVYKIKNIHYIPLIPCLTPKAKEIIDSEFELIKKYLLTEELYYCDYPFRLDLDIKEQIESSQDMNVKYKLFENFQYNRHYAPKSCQRLLDPIIRGCYRTVHYINALNEKGDINITMRYKIFDNSKYLIEVEIFMPPTQNINKIYQVIFYAYFSESNDEGFSLKYLLENWIQSLTSYKNKKENEKPGLIINFHNDKNESNIEDIQNKSYFEIIDINNTNNLENSLNQYMEALKTIRYNHKHNENNIKYNTENKLLLLICDDFNNLFPMIKAVSKTLYTIFMKDINFKSNLINNMIDGISQQFEKAEQKLKAAINNFPKRMEINKINDTNFEKIKKIIEIKKENMNLSLKSETNYNYNQYESCDANNNSIKLFIGTYNVNALEPSLINTFDLSPFLFPNKLNNYFTENNFPIFYCIGLEETIELNPQNVLLNPKSRSEIWEQRISSELQKKFNYFLLSKKNLVGLLLLFYVKTTELKYITNIQDEILKSGFIGFGNKGCIFLNFEYKEKKYGFCSCHLPAGQKEKHLINRKDIFNQILSYKIGKSETEFKNNDYYFIFGDLNFRTMQFGLISLKNHIKTNLVDKRAIEFSRNRNSVEKNKSKEKIKDKQRYQSEITFDNKRRKESLNISSFQRNNDNSINISHCKSDEILEKNEEINENLMDEITFTKFFFNEFLRNEELKIFKKTELVQFDIEEGEINFPPTYKYEKNTNSYNISKRVPSWTDRILYKNNKSLKSLFYDRIDINLSDHKPIFGFFEINSDEK